MRANETVSLQTATIVCFFFRFPFLLLFFIVVGTLAIGSVTYIAFQTLIEANVAVKTSDGYLLRLFCIGFTKKNAGQLKKTSYAKSSKIRQIRAKMIEHMQKEVRILNVGCVMLLLNVLHGRLF